MKIGLKNGNSLTENEVAAFERQIGFELPQDYRNFVLQNDGAEPDTNLFPIGKGDESGVNRFIPLRQTLRERGHIKGNIGADFLPVAWAECGDYVCLKVRNGEVFFWDHEEPTAHLKWRSLAESFTRFLESLQPFNVDDIELKPGQVEDVWVDPEFKKGLE